MGQQTYGNLPPALQEMELVDEAETYLEELTGVQPVLELGDVIVAGGRPHVSFLSTDYEVWFDALESRGDEGDPGPEPGEQLNSYRVTFVEDPDPGKGFEENLYTQQFGWNRGTRFGEVFLQDALGWPDELVTDRRRGRTARYQMQ